MAFKDMITPGEGSNFGKEASKELYGQRNFESQQQPIWAAGVVIFVVTFIALALGWRNPWVAGVATWLVASVLLLYFRLDYLMATERPLVYFPEDTHQNSWLAAISMTLRYSFGFPLLVALASGVIAFGAMTALNSSYADKEAYENEPVYTVAPPVETTAPPEGAIPDGSGNYVVLPGPLQTLVDETKSELETGNPEKRVVTVEETVASYAEDLFLDMRYRVTYDDGTFITMRGTYRTKNGEWAVQSLTQDERG